MSQEVGWILIEYILVNQSLTIKSKIPVENFGDSARIARDVC
jgi:hypothetical protein